MKRLTKLFFNYFLRKVQGLKFWSKNNAKIRLNKETNKLEYYKDNKWYDGIKKINDKYFVNLEEMKKFKALCEKIEVEVFEKYIG